jgi:hypothetical protein
VHLFGRSADLWLRLGLLSVPMGLALAVCVLWAVTSSAYVTREGLVEPQPVPFSHAHHVGGLRIDCRYCHEHVEHAPSAGMPPTERCMGCHEKVWPDAPLLAPVRESWRAGTRLRWTRVYDLPDFVSFDHSIHVAGGVGCATCHGRVDRMPLTRRASSLRMEWCLDCHRRPWEQLRPAEAVFDPAWEPPADQERRGRELMAERAIDPERLVHCSTCHR